MTAKKSKFIGSAGIMGVFTTLLSGFLNANTMELKVGDPAPQISAMNEDGQPTTLSYESEYTLVYFYPKADTPGCTAQACSLRDAYSELTEKGVVIYGVSADNVATQKKFKDKYRLPFKLLADTDKKVAQAFGVPVRFGFVSRQAFLIHKGKIVWLDRSASTKKQAQDILEFLKRQ